MIPLPECLSSLLALSVSLVQAFVPFPQQYNKYLLMCIPPHPFLFLQPSFTVAIVVFVKHKLVSYCIWIKTKQNRTEPQNFHALKNLVLAYLRYHFLLVSLLIHHAPIVPTYFQFFKQLFPISQDLCTYCPLPPEHSLTNVVFLSFSSQLTFCFSERPSLTTLSKVYSFYSFILWNSVNFLPRT